MFSEKQISLFDRSYFKVIAASPFAITVQSKNSRHFWHIIHQEYAGVISRYVIYHRHEAYGRFHEHGHARNVKAVVQQIMNHDKYWLTKEGQRYGRAK